MSRRNSARKSSSSRPEPAGATAGSDTTGAPPVARRLAFVFPGFEPIPVEAQIQRFMREAAKTASTYGMSVEAGPMAVAAAAVFMPSAAETEVAAAGEGWRTETAVVVYGLDDLNTLYAGRPRLARLAGGLAALGNFALTGTFFRYIATSWRYGLFFLYPVVITLVLFSAACAAMLLPACLLGAWHLGWSLPLGLGLWWLGFVLAERRMHYLLMMDDWACARDLAYGRRPELVAYLDEIGADLRRRIGASAAEEVIFAAHSFGAIQAVATLAETLRLDAFGGRRPGLLTAGSSLLKVALHPAAGTLRAAVETVAESGADWMDVQSLTDPMNFYRSDPVRALGIARGRSPRTVRVRFRSQLSPETYRRVRRNFFRVHRQFVFGVERRHPYAFHAILLGPERFRDVVARGGLAGEWGRS